MITLTLPPTMIEECIRFTRLTRNVTRRVLLRETLSADDRRRFEAAHSSGADFLDALLAYKRDQL